MLEQVEFVPQFAHGVNPPQSTYGGIIPKRAIMQSTEQNFLDERKYEWREHADLEESKDESKLAVNLEEVKDRNILQPTAPEILSSLLKVDPEIEPDEMKTDAQGYFEPNVEVIRIDNQEVEQAKLVDKNKVGKISELKTPPDVNNANTLDDQHRRTSEIEIQNVDSNTDEKASKQSAEIDLVKKGSKALIDRQGGHNAPEAQEIFQVDDHDGQPIVLLIEDGRSTPESLPSAIKVSPSASVTKLVLSDRSLSVNNPDAQLVELPLESEEDHKSVYGIEDGWDSMRPEANRWDFSAGKVRLDTAAESKLVNKPDVALVELPPQSVVNQDGVHGIIEDGWNSRLPAANGWDLSAVEDKWDTVEESKDMWDLAIDDDLWETRVSNGDGWGPPPSSILEAESRRSTEQAVSVKTLKLLPIQLVALWGPVLDRWEVDIPKNGWDRALVHNGWDAFSKEDGWNIQFQGDGWRLEDSSFDPLWPKGYPSDYTHLEPQDLTRPIGKEDSVESERISHKRLQKETKTAIDGWDVSPLSDRWSPRSSSGDGWDTTASFGDRWVTALTPDSWGTVSKPDGWNAWGSTVSYFKSTPFA